MFRLGLAMTDLDAFLPSIRPYAPGVSDLIAYFGIRQAAIEFCERTKSWRFEDEFDVSSDECEALMSPPGSVIHLIEGVWFEGNKLEPVTPEHLDNVCPGWRAGADVSGVPQYVTQTAQNTITLVPRTAGRVKLSLFLKPSDDAEDLPSFLAAQHRMTIAHGALAHILLIPNQSFTNAELAGAFGQSFQGKLDGKALLGSVGQQRARPRVKAQFF